MNVGTEINSLNVDIDACQDKILTVLTNMNNPKPMISSSCDCQEKSYHVHRSNTYTKTQNAYHQKCVPQKTNQTKNPKKAALKSCQKPGLNHKEQFVTNRGLVEVQVKSSTKPGLFKRDNSKTRDQTAETKCFGMKEGTKPEKLQTYLQEEVPVKKKTSWSNILKEQNKIVLDKCDPPTAQQITDGRKAMRVLSTRTSSCDEKLLMEPNCGPCKMQPDNLRPGREPRDNAIFQDKSIQCTKTQDAYIKNSRISSSLSNNAFASFNPVRTLQFLMTEFRSKVKKMDEVDLNSMVQDMENALQRITYESNCSDASAKESNVNYPPSTKSGLLSVSSKEQQSDKEKLEQSSSRLSLQKKLEESCLKLEETCHQMELTCSRLKEERDELIKELAEKDRKLGIAAAKESDYEVRLNEYSKLLATFTAKGDQYNQSIQGLTEMLTRLQEENKMLGVLKEKNREAANKLQDVSKENGRLNGQIQLLQLEREKNIVLIQARDQELGKLKKDIEALSGLVNSELKNLVVLNCSTDWDSSTLSSCSMTVLNQKPKAGHQRPNMSGDDGLVASSPNSSSATSSPLPYRSWQRFSGISGVDNQSISSQAVHTQGALPAPQVMARIPTKADNAAKFQNSNVDEVTVSRGHSPDGNPETIQALRSQLKDLFSEMRRQLPSLTAAGSDMQGVERQQTVWSDITSVATTSNPGMVFTSLTSNSDHTASFS